MLGGADISLGDLDNIFAQRQLEDLDNRIAELSKNSQSNFSDFDIAEDDYMDADGKLQKKDEYFDDFDSDEFDSDATIANGVEPPVKAKDAQTLISDELLRYYNNPKVEEDEHEKVRGVYEVNLETPQDEQKDTREDSSKNAEISEDSDDIDIDMDEMPDDVELDTIDETGDSENDAKSEENDDLDIEFLDDDSLENFEDVSDVKSISTLNDNDYSNSIVDSNQQDSDDDNEFGIDFSDVDFDDMDDSDDETSQNSEDTQGSQTYEVKNVENSDDANDSSDDKDHDSLDDIDLQDLDDLDESESDSESQDREQSLTQDQAVHEVDEDTSNDEDNDSDSDDDFDIDLSDIEDSDSFTEDSDDESSAVDKSDNEEKSESEQSDELDDIDFQDLDDIDINDDEKDSNSGTNETKTDSEEKSESAESDDIDLSDFDDLDDLEEAVDDTENNKKSLSGADDETQSDDITQSDDDITKTVKDTTKEVKVENNKSAETIEKVVKTAEPRQKTQIDDEVAELERKLAEAKKRKALADSQAKQMRKPSTKTVVGSNDDSLEAQKRRAAQLASEMRAKKQGRQSLDVPQKSIKRPAQSLLSENKLLNKNNNNSLPVRKKLTRHEKYAQLTDDRLMEYVRRFLQKNGVSKKPVDRKLLDAEFGSQNIQKLIKKSCLVSIGHGITLGL